MSPTSGCAEALADPVDEHALADLQRRDHRLARDAVRLDEERLDAEREPERDGDDQDELDQRARRRRRLGAATPPTWTRRPRRRVGLGRGGAPRRRRRPRPRRPRRRQPPRRSASLGLRGLGSSLGGVASASSSACWSTASPGTSSSAAAAASAAGSCSRPACDDLLRADVAALADAGALADPAAQVVELGAPDVAAGGDLDPLDLRRVHRERALHADAERVLADREGLAHALALALDHHALEDLGAAAGALDDLEVDADAVTRRRSGGRGGAAGARGCR